MLHIRVTALSKKKPHICGCAMNEQLQQNNQLSLQSFVKLLLMHCVRTKDGHSTSQMVCVH